MSKIIAQRVNPLDGRIFGGNGVSLHPAEFATRISLRVRSKGKATVKKALGFVLPAKPKSSFQKGSTTAFWLSPDEWFLYDEKTDAGLAKLEKLSAADASVVDISHRNCAIIVSGPNAVAAINAGCPQDLALSIFPVGAVSRTIIAKAEVILHRTGENEFRVECWRSFADYMWKFLEEAAKSA